MTAIHNVERGIMTTVGKEPLSARDESHIVDELVDRLDLQPGTSSDLLYSRTTTELALGILQLEGKITPERTEEGVELRYNPPEETPYEEGLRPLDLWTQEELDGFADERDLFAVESLFAHLTTQKEMPQDEAIVLAKELIHAIEKVQKNLDNLI